MVQYPLDIHILAAVPIVSFDEEKRSKGDVPHTRTTATAVCRTHTSACTYKPMYLRTAILVHVSLHHAAA
jgi:hypothetical protein